MKKTTLLAKSTLVMGLFAALSSGTASANDDKEISKDYTITITHAHTGNTSMIVNEQPVLMSAQYSESRQLVTITFDKAVTAQDLTSLALTKNGQVIANTSYIIDSADATKVTANVVDVKTADELSVKFKKAGEVSVPVSKVATAKFVPKLEVVRKLNKKVVGKVERGAKISAVLTDAKGVQIPQKINVKRSGNWTYEANVAPGSYMLTVVAEKNDQTATKNVAVHIVK